MGYCVYILHSAKINRFYIGSTKDIEQRIAQHNNPDLNHNWTKRGIPWQIFLTIPIDSQQQALKIERYLKKMKSRKYIVMLKENPDLIPNLINKFSV